MLKTSCAFIFCCIFSITSLKSAKAEDNTSYINLPISASYAELNQLLNENIPTEFAAINQPGHVCVEAKWLKTKVPEFRGLKIYTKILKTKVSPEIRCDVTGWVRRTGPVNLGRHGSAIRIIVPVAAQATVRGRGSIGQNIRETGNAAANFVFDVEPSLSSNWEPAVKVVGNFGWTVRPQMQLFGFIKVTFGSDVEPKVREKMAELQAQLPNTMKKFEFRQKAETVWKELQKPIVVSKEPPLFLSVNPQGIGFSGLGIGASNLSTQLSFKAQPLLTTAEPVPDAATPLPNLTKPEEARGWFKITLPAVLNLKSVEALARRQLPQTIKMPKKDDGASVTMTVTSLTLGPDDADGFIKLAAGYKAQLCGSIAATIFSIGQECFDNEGKLTIITQPSLDGNVLVGKNASISTDSSNPMVDLMLKLGQLPVLSLHLNSLLRVDLAPLIAEQVSELENALNRDIAKDLHLSGSMKEVGVTHLSIAGQNLRVSARVQGEIGLRLGDGG